MKKKLLSLALALALCMGLTVPALADDGPFPLEVGLSKISFTCDIGSGNFEDTDVAQPVTISTIGDIDTETMVQREIDGYVNVRQNTVFTVKHMGEQDDGSFIRVYMTPYTKAESGVYEWPDFHQYYLTKNDGFYEDYVDPNEPEAGGLVELHAGESCQFSLPAWEEDGEEILWKVEPTLYYPEYEYAYWKFEYLLKDDAAVEAALANPAPKSAFTDVAADSPYKDAIAWAVEQKITNGTGENTFSPDATCTHNQILTFLWRANGSPASKGDNDYDRAAAWAREKGIRGAYEPYNGNGNCTRAWAMRYLWRMAGSPKTETKATFTDLGIEEDLAQAVAWAVAQGITKGTSDTTFSPDATCTRGQIVTFLHRNLAK